MAWMSDESEAVAEEGGRGEIEKIVSKLYFVVEIERKAGGGAARDSPRGTGTLSSAATGSKDHTGALTVDSAAARGGNATTAAAAGAGGAALVVPFLFEFFFVIFELQRTRKCKSRKFPFPPAQPSQPIRCARFLRRTQISAENKKSRRIHFDLVSEALSFAEHVRAQCTSKKMGANRASKSELLGFGNPVVAPSRPREGARMLTINLQGLSLTHQGKSGQSRLKKCKLQPKLKRRNANCEGIASKQQGKSAKAIEE